MRTLKALRSWEPANRVLTAAVSALVSPFGPAPDLVVRHVQRVGEVRRRLPNGRSLRLWSRGDDWIANEVYWRGALGYEPETSNIFFALAGGARTVFDIGSFVGYYALVAALAEPSSRVFAFEPHPGALHRLRRNIALNGLRNVEVVPAAVGEASGEVNFYHAASGLPSSSSLSQAFMRKAIDPVELAMSAVPLIALDAFAADRAVERVDLIKIDTESTEPQVLDGMARLLARDRPAIICEVLEGWGVESKLEARLAPLGYHVYLLTADGPVRREGIRADERFRNQLFTPTPIESKVPRTSPGVRPS